MRIFQRTIKLCYSKTETLTNGLLFFARPFLWRFGENSTLDHKIRSVLMNTQRRSKIRKLIKRLEAIQSELDDLHSEEQDARDNLPEGLQDSQRASDMDDALQQLEEAADRLMETVDALGVI